ncbi:MAG: ATP-dependent DNA helicase RecG [Phycisphaerales bacterium]|nr:ATP-dependent DNA helicase RecG [Phycisphaerales bacterium]
MTAAPGLTLTTPLAEVPGIQPKQASLLATLGLTNLGRLIAHLPHRHERHEAESPIKDLVPNQIVSARGEVTASRWVPRGRRPRLEAVLLDGTGRLDLVWFNMPYMRERIRPGVRIRVQGQGKRMLGGLRMVNPHTEILHEDRGDPGMREERLRPVYPASERVPSSLIERAIASALPHALPLIEDHLPDAFRAARNFPALSDAYRMQHRPGTEDEVAASRRRLAYDELLLLQLGVHLKRAHLRSFLKAPALRWSEKIDEHIRARLPFTLTPAQAEVVREIVADLSKATPTNRLIQGDVGAGKTVVAAYAMLLAVADRQQAALMAPTEILAEQHFASLSDMLKGSGVRHAILTGATPKAEREATLAGVASGTIDLLIGTHALLTESVKFDSLAVAVIDEQHRFGVHQRATLRTKGGEETITPHVLVMTATPIPRTLAITLFGDLDISTIRGLPPGRRPVKTRVVAPDKRGEVYSWLRQRLDQGDQAFIVAPAIDSPESFEGEEITGGDQPGAPGPLANVHALKKELEADPLKDKHLAVLHGRLKPQTRDTIMARFRAGQIDALIATSVIEVGIDIPNATTMVVENADRFGLAQLHQLRGRVGRGVKPSACILVAEPQTPEATQRMRVMAEVGDGFALAEKDMEIRGPGELFGTRQSGLPPFKVADLARDLELLAMARRDAAEWIAGSPTLHKPEETLIRRRLMKTYGESLGLVDVG